MPQQPEPPRLAYRLLDANTGAVVVPDLYHLHASTWTVRSLVLGYPGSTTLGDFRIALPPPSSEEHWRYRSQYDAILNSTNSGIGLKVEAYDSNVNAGPPVMSGVITKMDLPLDTPWVLSGIDTLFWLQQSTLLTNETFETLFPSQLGRLLLGTQEALWDDDFTNWSGGASYSVSGVWVATTDPVLGLPAIRTTTVGGTIATTTTWTSNQFAYVGAPAGAASITLVGVIAPGTDTTDSGDMGILLLSDSSGANGTLVQVLTKQVGFTYSVDVAIKRIVAGVYTTLATTANVFTNVGTPFAFELTALLEGTGTAYSSGVGLRAILNGSDTGCLTSGSFTTHASPHSVGVQFGAHAGGSPTGYATRLTFHSRTLQDDVFALGNAWGVNRFQEGVWTPSANQLPTATIGQGQTHLDILLQLACFDGYHLRKTAKAGYKADVLDYSPSVGTDFSLSIVFLEGGNVIASGTTFQNVAEVFATDIRLNAVPGGDSGGSVTWGRVAAPGDMVLTDAVADVGYGGFAAFIRYASQIATRKASPLSAIQVTVARTPELLSVNNGWGPREWDFVQVHMPSYNINRQTAQIVGYTVDETAATMTYFLTQFPEGRFPHHGLGRIHRSLDYLTATYVSRS